MQDPTPPEVLDFLVRVRAETREGEVIGLALAPPHDGFSYTYWRANYVLAGRMVLPPHAGRAHADVLASWGRPVDDTRFEILWTDGASAVARRRQ